MTPPAGRERLFAVWTRQPLSLRLDQLHSLVERKNGDSPASRPYVATRDMKRVQQSVQQLRPEDWHAVVLELDHVLEGSQGRHVEQIRRSELMARLASEAIANRQ